MSKNPSRFAAFALLGLALAAAGCDRQDSSPEQVNATAETVPVENASAANDAFVVDTIGTLDRSHKGEAAPTLRFQAPNGVETSAAQFAGKPLLINLWATWCAPCVKEMPTLDAMAAVHAGTLQVVPVSQDLDGAAKVTPFFAAHGFKTLQPYLDPQASLSIAYQASLPMSILYDSTGHEVWRMTGAMDWTTETARGLLAEAR